MRYVAHLLGRAERGAGRRPEGEARRPLHRPAQTVDQPGELRVLPGTAALAAAARERQRRREQRRARPARRGPLMRPPGSRRTSRESRGRPGRWPPRRPRGRSRTAPASCARRALSGTKIRLPMSAPRNTVSRMPCQPRNAPTIAIILMSPPPIASCLKIQLARHRDDPEQAEADRRAEERRAERLAARQPGRTACPATRPPSENSSGMM